MRRHRPETAVTPQEKIIHLLPITISQMVLIFIHICTVIPNLHGDRYLEGGMVRRVDRYAGFEAFSYADKLLNKHKVLLEGSDVLTSLLMNITVFWDTWPCRLVYKG
jgi:hypothetical protein